MFEVDASHYLPLGSRITLASHAALRFMPVGLQTPFWALSQLGGDLSVIGAQYSLWDFGDVRFVDRHSFAANTELRTRILERDLFGAHTILEIAPFLDLGGVFHRMDKNPLNKLHPVVGLGFRGSAAPFVTGSVDIGYGREGFAVLLGVNYPF